MCLSNLLWLFLVVILISYFVFQHWEAWSDTNRIIEGLHGKRTGVSTGVFSYEGQAFTLHYDLSWVNNVSELRVYGEGNFFGHMTISRKEVLDYLAEKIGFNPKTKRYGKVELDDALHFECEEPVFVEAFMAAPEVGLIVKELLQKFDLIEIDGARCAAVKLKMSNDLISDFDISDIQNAAQRILLLMKHIPHPTGGSASATPLTDDLQRFTNLFFQVSAGLSLIGVCCSFVLGILEPVSLAQIFWSTLWVGLLAVIVFIGFAFYKLNGHRTSLVIFLICFLWASLGLILLVWSGAAFLNEKLDVSQARSHEVEILDKSMSPFKGGFVYYITVSSWNRNMPRYTFKVADNLYGQLKRSNHCVITTKDGFFGFEWIVSRECKSQ